MCPMTRPDTGSCGTCDPPVTGTAHNVQTDHFSPSDRTRERCVLPSMSRPSQSPHRNSCEFSPVTTRSNPSFASRTTNQSRHLGCRFSNAGGGTSSRSRPSQTLRSSWTPRPSGFPATRTATEGWRPVGTSSVFTRCLTKQRALRSRTTPGSRSLTVTVLPLSHVRPRPLGLMSS